MKVNSKKEKISGIGWCYEITAEPENKEKNVAGDKKVSILTLNKKSK